MTKWKGTVASYAPNVAHLVASVALPGVLAAGLSMGQAAAADRYWDANRTSPGYGGSGTWDLSAGTWSPSSDGVSGPYMGWNNSALDTAVFGGTAGTVTLGAPITANGLTFETNGYTLLGDTLDLAGAAPTIAVNTGTTTINSVITGSSGLTKAAGGTLVLNGFNTFAGAVYLNAGTLRAGSDAALGSTSNDIFTAAGAVVALEMEGAGTNRTIHIGDGGTIRLGGSGTSSALITGDGHVRVTARGTLNNDNSTYTGSTTFYGLNGVAWNYFTSIGNLGEASSLGAPTTVENGTIVFNQASQYSDNIVYLGDGDSSNRNWDLNGANANIRNQGTGTLSITGNVDTAGGSAFFAENADFELLGVLSGDNYFFTGLTGRSIALGGASTYTGTTTIGTVTVYASELADVGTASSFGAGNAAITIQENGVVSYTGAGASSNRNWSIATGSILNDGTGALTLSGALDFETTPANGLTLGGSFAGTNTLSGDISGDGTLGSTGSGTWVLTGENSDRTGAIIVDGGTLRAGSATAFGTTTSVTVNGGTLDLARNDLTTSVLQGTGGTIALDTATLSVDTEVDTRYAGTITGSGVLEKIGAGTLTLSGANTYTGDTLLSGGGLTLDFAASGAPSSNIISDDSTLNMAGGRLDIVGGTVANVQTFDGLNITAGSNRIGATSGAGGSVAVNFGEIIRTGGLVDFSLPAAGNFTTSNVELGGWATVNGTDYAKVVGGIITAFTEADYTDKDDAATWLSNEIISDTGGGANSPFNGTLSGSQQLGGLKYTAAADSTVTVGTGETLGIDGTIIVAASVGEADQTISGGSLTGSSGGGALGVLQNGQGTFNIESHIVNNGGSTGFTKGGSGIVRLAGDNTYTGVTTLSGGTLEIERLANAGSASSIGAASADSSNLVLESGTLHYRSEVDSSTDRGLTLVNGGAEAPTIQVDASRTIEFSGLVTSPDDAGLTKTGWGTLVLSNAANDYVGVTTITGAGAGGASTLSVNTLANGGAVSGIGAATSESSNLVLSSGGRLQYTGDTVAIDRGFTLGSGSGRIDVTQSDTTLTFGGIAVGTGGLVKEGVGTLVLAGSNTYSGNTTVSAGTLRAGSAQAFGAASNSLDVSSGALVELGGFNITAGALIGAGAVDLGGQTLTTSGGSGTFTGRITGTGGFTRTGNYTQTMSGCGNDYTGVTTIQGTLSVDCLADGGQASGIGASSNASSSLVFDGGRLTYTGGSIAIDRGFTLTSNGYVNVASAATVLEFEGVVAGGGQLRKEGDGVLVLSGTNTYTGDTVISGGILRAGASDTLGTRGFILENAAGVALDLAGYDHTIGFLNGGGALGGNVTLGDATLTLNWSSGSAEFAGAISGSGGLIKNGGLSQTLTSCASDYDGATTINGGVLAVSCLTDGGADSSIGSSSADAANLVLNGGTLSYIGTGGETDRRFTLGASAGNKLDASGTGAIAFTSGDEVTFATANAAQTLTLAGTNQGDNILAAQLTNNGTGQTSLSKTGTGTWILTNPNSTYTGATVISGGVLGVDKLADGGLASSLGASSAAASNLVIGNNSTLRYTGSGDTTNRLFTLAAGTTTIQSSGTGAIVFTDTGPVTLSENNQTRTIALGGTNTDDNTLAGSIGNAGTGATILAKNDSGTWVLTGNNTYTGNTVINDGTLKIGNGGTTGSIISNTINLAALVFDRSDEYTYGGVISDVGTVEQAGSGTTILTGTNTYTGGTTISDGTLQLGNGGTSGSIVGNVANDGMLAFDRSDSYTFAGIVSGSGALSQIGSGTTILTGANTYTGGTTISDGTLQIGSGGTSGSIVGDVANSGALVFDRSDDVTFAGLISGNGTVEQAGSGTTVLTGNSTYTGGTTISDGTLQLGAGGTTGGIVGDVANNGTLVVNRGNDLTLDGTISGSGGINQIGAGTTTLAGNNTYTGATNVLAGTLLVNGDQSAAGGLTSVASGATLGGNGTIGGDVSMADGAILSAGAGGVGTLTIDGNLDLSSGTVLNFQFGQADVAGGTMNDLVNVGGDLTLAGTVNVEVPTGGAFGAGVYRMFNYTGELDDQGLVLGTMPSGSEVTVQTSIANQVNLVNSAGMLLTFWDGDAGPKFDGTVNGGNGTWQNSAGNDNWTNAGGGVNAAFEDAGFAIFMGAAGTVTVNNGLGAVTVAGMQFATDGYLISGGDIALVGEEVIIRVGDDSADSADYVATIASNLTGASQLVKTDAGTLVLTGANTYSGGTLISGGTLQIGNGLATGSIMGDVVNNGTLAFNRSGPGTFAGIVSGTGALNQIGTGTTTLTADHTYTGGTLISAGTLQIGNGGTSGSIVGDVVNNAALTFNRSDDTSFAGAITGTGNLSVVGGGVLRMTGDSNYTGTTQITGSELRLENGGSITSGDTTLAGPNATLTVAGEGSSFTTTQLEMGTSTAGEVVTLNIENGGQVITTGTAQLDLGTPNSIAIVNVSGAGSLWDVGGSVEVARWEQASATVNVTGGGSVRSASLAMGPVFESMTNPSNVTISGAGSSWISTGSLSVRRGTLSLLDGGRLEADSGTITGASATLEGQGRVIIDGEGSELAIAQALTIGTNAKEAVVTVSNGGQLSAGGLLTLARFPGSNGTLNIGAAASATAAAAGTVDVADIAFGPGTGTINFNHTDADYDFAAAMREAGAINQLSGTTILSGDSAGFSGLTTVSGGALYANNALGGNVTVATGGTLGGIGTIGGNVDVADGMINPGDLGTAPGTLTIGGNLSLASASTLNYNFGQAGVVGGAFNDLIAVEGDLVLDGTLNVSTSEGGSFDPGVYRVISYGGDLTANNGLAIGTIPSDDFYVQTSVSGQVNLVNTAGLTLNYWDGATTASRNNETIEGGNGVWQAAAGGTGNDNWTDQDGIANAPFSDASFAVFMGEAGTVSVDDSLGAINVSGMQFLTDGYVIEGDEINLAGDETSIIRVGDGTAGGAGISTTIGSVLTGDSDLVKTDLGTLILTGNNTYTGATAVNGGTLLVNGDQTAVDGLTTVNSGTLGGTGIIGGDVNVGGGTIAPGSNGVGTLTVSGNMSLDAGTTLAMEFGEADVAGGALNDLIVVDGNLVLDGTINVAVPDGGSFGAGIYRVFNYGGELTDNGLEIGTMPVGTVTLVQTSIEGQVNLINTGGLFLNYWDGAAGPDFDGVINGGDGVWQSGSGNDSWTDDAGRLNAPYQNGGFAIFAGAAGTVTVDNGVGQVSASGMQFASGGYTITGAGVELVGPQATIRVGDGTTAGSGFIATIASQISGASQIVKTDAGTLVLTGNNTYAGGTAINGGTLQVAADTALGDAEGGLSFNGGTLHTTADMASERSITFTGDGTLLTDEETTLTLDGLLSGSGTLTKDGAGTLLVTADNSDYLGETTVKAGTLAVDGMLGGEVDVASGGRLEGDGTVGSVTNAGIVGPGRSIGTLTIAGNYVGDGGVLEIETVLGGDGSETDLLAVNGDTSGTTTVNVLNRDGLGAQTQEGIKIIDVGGASDGTFTLNGDYLFEGEQAVVAGAYGYRLYKNGVTDPTDGDWYLRSSLLEPADSIPLYQPGVPLYESYAGALQQLNKLGTLQQRVGNRVWAPQATAGEQAAGTGAIDTSGVWARIEASHANHGPDDSTSATSYETSTWKFQAGIDGLLLEDEAGHLVGGFNAQFGTVSSRVSSAFGIGNIDTSGFGVGATLTWYGANGFYADGQANVTWYDSDLRSATAGQRLVSGNDGMGYGLSIEVGQRMTLNENWSLTPQGQLAYSSVDFDDFTDVFGARVSLRSGESLVGRLGVALDRNSEWQGRDGRTSRSHVYGIANLYYDFADGSDVDVAGTRFASGGGQLHGGLGIGGSLNWADDAYSVFGEANVSTNLENVGDNNAVGGTVGFRVRW